MHRLPWWQERAEGGLMSYWIYQHIGNLSPPELEEEELLRFVRSDTDAGPRLRLEARRWDRESAASRWAYYRDFGDSRLLVLDSRAARVLGEQQLQGPLGGVRSRGVGIEVDDDAFGEAREQAHLCLGECSA